MATILSVDDDLDIGRVIKSILSREGHDVVVTESGKHALKLVDKIQPDLIFLDIMMKEFSGWDTLNEMRRLNYLKNVPITMLTSLSYSHDIAAKIETHDSVNFMQKPFTKEEIIARANQAIYGTKQSN